MLHFLLMLRRLQPGVTPTESLAAAMDNGNPSSFTLRKQPTSPASPLVFPNAKVPRGKPPTDSALSRSRRRDEDAIVALCAVVWSTERESTGALFDERRR